MNLHTSNSGGRERQAHSTVCMPRFAMLGLYPTLNVAITTSDAYARRKLVKYMGVYYGAYIPSRIAGLPGI